MPLPILLAIAGSTISKIIAAGAVAAGVTGVVIANKNSSKSNCLIGEVSKEEFVKNERKKIYNDLKESIDKFIISNYMLMRYVYNEKNIDICKNLSHEVVEGKKTADAAENILKNSESHMKCKLYVDDNDIEDIIDACEIISDGLNVMNELDEISRSAINISISLSETMQNLMPLEALDMLVTNLDICLVDHDEHQLLGVLNDYLESPKVVLKEDFTQLERLGFLGRLGIELIAAGEHPVALPTIRSTYYMKNYPEIVKGLEDCKKIHSCIDEKEFRVVVCGLLKAGKSTLLNMLTNNIEKEYFATKAIRATSKNKEAVCGGVMYIDTPGLDAPGYQGKEDALEAYNAYFTADLILFVHSAERTLTDEECKIIKNILEEREKEIIFVLTYTDQLSNDYDKGRMVSAIQQQLKDNKLESVSTIFCVGNKTYQKGVIEGKPLLRRTGGVDDLREELFRKRDNGLNRVMQNRRNIFDRAYKNIIFQCLSETREVMKNLLDQKKNFSELSDDFFKKVIEPVKIKLSNIN